MQQTNSQSTQQGQRPERRHGPNDRRKAREDRRNEERATQELDPRRNPDVADRRH